MRSKEDCALQSGRCVGLTLVLGVMMLGNGAVNAAGDPVRGEVLYKDCQNCHSIDKNDTGPMHKGVVGRMAGTVPGYDYSPALKNAKIIWSEENLDKWLANPEELVPGTKMLFAVDDPKDRADLIAFLRDRAR